MKLEFTAYVVDNKGRHDDKQSLEIASRMKLCRNRQDAWREFLRLCGGTREQWRDYGWRTLKIKVRMEV